MGYIVIAGRGTALLLSSLARPLGIGAVAG